MKNKTMEMFEQIVKYHNFSDEVEAAVLDIIETEVLPRMRRLFIVGLFYGCLVCGGMVYLLMSI